MGNGPLNGVKIIEFAGLGRGLLRHAAVGYGGRGFAH